MTADFARLRTFYHSLSVFCGNAIKKNRSESVPDGHKSDGIQIFQNFSKDTLENFHVRIRYALVETSVQVDGFSAADFFHFFCPIGKEEAVFSCIFFDPLFADKAFLNHGPYHDGDCGIGQVEVVFQYFLGDYFLFMCGQVGDDKCLAGGEPVFFMMEDCFRSIRLWACPKLYVSPI